MYANKDMIQLVSLKDIVFFATSNTFVPQKR